MFIISRYIDTIKKTKYSACSTEIVHEKKECNLKNLVKTSSVKSSVLKFLCFSSLKIPLSHLHDDVYKTRKTWNDEHVKLQFHYYYFCVNRYIISMCFCTQASSMKHQDLNECYCRTTNKLEINLCNSGGFFSSRVLSSGSYSASAYSCFSEVA